MKYPVIGFRATAPQSGKSTCANLLTGAHRFVIVPFGAPIKQMLRVLGLGNFELYSDFKRKPCPLLIGKTPQFAMQELGEMLTTRIHPRLLVAHWQRVAFDVLDEGGRVIADDVRRSEEAEAIRSAGGVVINIHRPSGAAEVNHAAERHEFAADFDLVNDGTIEQLHEKLLAILN